MRKTQTIFAMVLAIVMVFALSIGVFAEAPETTEAPEDVLLIAPAPEAETPFTGKTVILHSNDVHGALEGYAYIAAVKADFEAKGAEVILADAGDFSQGSPLVSISKGETAIDMMNAAGYDVVTLGNHEFDYGYEQLMANLEKGTFKAICADVLKDGKTILDPNVIIEKGGVKIGFFGLETPETLTKVNPGLIKGITFLNNTDGKTELYDCAAEQVKELKEAGADLIIGLFHLGVADESKTDGHRSMDVLAKVEGIDLVLDGHSHSVMTEGENGEPIQSTGKYLPNIGVVVIDNESKTIEDRYLVPVKTTDEEGNVVSELAKDEAVLAKAQEIIAAVDEQYGAVFAVSEVELEGNAAPGNRTQETNNGNLITDAMLWSVLKEGELAVPTENVVAITNGGGIRAPIAVGDVSMKDINSVLPFGNTVAVIYVTGAELLEALEASTFCTPTKIGGYPQTAGIKFNLDLSKPYDANAETYPDSTYYGPASIRRVTIKSVNGKDFDETATYAVVTNNFCAAGGDTYYAFKRAFDAGDGFDTGIPLDEAVMSYVTEELKGVISAEKYAEPRGDLTYEIENYSVTVAAEDIVDGEVTLDVTMFAIEDAAHAATLTVDLPDGLEEIIEVEIPVEGVTAADVVYLVGEDGEELELTGMTERGLTIALDGDAVLKIVRVKTAFEDVAEDYWGAEAVTFMAARGLMRGVNSKDFAPAATMDRAQITTVLYRLMGELDFETTAAFTDVEEGQWYTDAINWAAEFGVVEGYGETFGVADPVTREQIAVMLWRLFGAAEEEEEAVETGASEWAADAMSWAVNNGLLQGDGHGYNPQGEASRAEVATLLMRILNL